MLLRNKEQLLSYSHFVGLIWNSTWLNTLTTRALTQASSSLAPVSMEVAVSHLLLWSLLALACSHRCPCLGHLPLEVCGFGGLQRSLAQVCSLSSHSLLTHIFNINILCVKHKQLSQGAFWLQLNKQLHKYLHNTEDDHSMCFRVKSNSRFLNLSLSKQVVSLLNLLAW